MTLRLHAFIEIICMMTAEVAVERVAFLLPVRELSGTSLGLEANYGDWSVLEGCSVTPGKCQVTAWNYFFLLHAFQIIIY